ncbi:T/G mismatch-specific endonuclease [Aminicella lysinilytica]|uniref:Very short patch repair endonuclease n=1 Tax=Aminicella lysinilytica TaxID=433323 RepID=A0A4R6PWP2_9FIRM|nr:very short patch repair endonuclease [Aminicella lysinilytica]TDP46462.1 T/G mismatch-specific endonuclease [Aminicella lysinilytica]
MLDDHTLEQRSYNMSKIKRKDTKPELIVRKYLFSKGLRYRIDDKRYPGRPDLVLPKYKTVIYVNGCFWHHHNCKYFVWPKSNIEYWREKIEKNVSRDTLNYNKMKDMGWSVIIIWECQLKKDKREETLDELFREIVNTNGSYSSEVKLGSTGVLLD